MQTLERRAFLAGTLHDAVSTTAASESPISRGFGQDDAARAAWDLIENKLIQWGCNPSQLDEEDTQTPSRETIQLAIQLAAWLCQQGFPAPTRVVPDAHGGIVFELHGKTVFESLHIEPSSAIEHRLFVQHRLVLRESWEFRAG
jgi:hypothetical protein